MDMWNGCAERVNTVLKFSSFKPCFNSFFFEFFTPKKTEEVILTEDRTTEEERQHILNGNESMKNISIY